MKPKLFGFSGYGKLMSLTLAAFVLGCLLNPKSPELPAAAPNAKDKVKGLLLTVGHWRISIPDSAREMLYSRALRFSLPTDEKGDPNSPQLLFREQWRMGGLPEFPEVTAFNCAAKDCAKNEHYYQFQSMMDNGLLADDGSFDIDLAGAKRSAKSFKGTGKKVQQGGGWTSWGGHKVWFIRMEKEDTCLCVMLLQESMEKTAKEFLETLAWDENAQERFVLRNSESRFQFPKSIRSIELINTGFITELFPKMKLDGNCDALDEGWRGFLRFQIWSKEELKAKPERAKMLAGLVYDEKKDALALAKDAEVRKIGNASFACAYKFEAGKNDGPGIGRMPGISPARFFADWSAAAGCSGLCLHMEADGGAEAKNPEETVKAIMDEIAKGFGKD